MKSPLINPTLLVLLAVFLTGCICTVEQPVPSTSTTSDSGKLVSCELGTTRNSHRIGDILLAGQPSASDMQIAANIGVRTVVTLRHPQELTDWDEEETVTSAGMKFISIPFKPIEELTDEVFNEARRQFRSAEKPILVHCSSANRVAAVWIPYRVLDEGIAYEQALTEAREIGLRTAEYQLRAQEYIERNQ